MAHKDLHQSLKSEIISSYQNSSTKFVVTKLQWNKDDIGHSLHVSPNSYTTAGLQLTDFLKMIGFERTICSFIETGQCYVKSVEADFNIHTFAQNLEEAYKNLQEGQKSLEKCSFILNQPEGWAFFTGSNSSMTSYDTPMAGDGHTAESTKLFKQSENSDFTYKLTWLESGSKKGWTFHYKPKTLPLNKNIESLFKYLKINRSSQCPEFDFEHCYWHSIAFKSIGDGYLDRNTSQVHEWFNAHEQDFSKGIKLLLNANYKIMESGFTFL